MCTIAAMFPALRCVVATPTHLLRRARSIVLAVLALLVVLGPASAPAMADGPCGILGTYETGAAESCTFSWPADAGVAAAFQVPDGVTEVGLRLVGGRGGYGQAGTSCGVYPGGRGGLVTTTASVTPGTYLSVIVGGNGQNGCKQTPGTGGYGGSVGGGGLGGTAAATGGTSGGGGGGSSRVLSHTNDILAVAGGGGGAASVVGFGGDADSNGGGTVVRTISAAGGGAGTQAAGGAGGDSGMNYALYDGTRPTAGTATVGGTGGSLGTRGLAYGAGGGGGGGYFGGGGGGAAVSNGGGGGGGSSYSAAPGASFTVTSESPSITVSWSRSAPDLAVTVGNATTGTDWGDTGRLGQRAFASAQLGAVNGSPLPTGSATIELFAAASCAGTSTSTESVTVGADGTITSANSAALARGAYSYRVSYRGDIRYRPASRCVDFEAKRYPQAVEFTNNGEGRRYRDRYTPTTQFTSPAGPASRPAIEVKVASATAGVCRLDGAEVEFIGAGTCTLEASAPGDGTYEPSPTVTQTFEVAKADLRLETNSMSIKRGDPRPTAPFTWGINGTDLLRGDTQVDVVNATTGTPDCSVAPYPDVPGYYEDIFTCLPGTLTHPNYRYVSGNTGSLQIDPVTQVAISPTSKDLGAISIGTSKTFEIAYSVEGDDVIVPEAFIDSPDADVEVTNLPLIVPGGTTATLTVKVTPRTPGAFRATLKIYGSLVETDTVTITGEASYTYDTGRSFTSTTTLPVPDPVSAVVVDTFDRDPYPDIAVASASTGHVWILRGRGNGSFLPAVQAEGDFEPGRTGLASGDLDGDGDIDLTTGSRFYLNDGDGQFAATSVRFPPVTDVGLADLDADADLDLIVRVGEGLAAFKNNGSGIFTDGSEPIGAWPVDHAEGLLVADVDRDGDTDIALISNEQDNQTNDTLFIALFRNDGQGALTQEKLLVGEYAQTVTVGDINGDLRPDLYYGDGFLPGRADGSFGPRERAPGQGSGAMLVTDFDGDKRDDQLAAWSGYANAEMIYGGSTPGSPDRQNYPGGEENDATLDPAGMAAADFDRDGRMDAVIVRQTSAVSLLLNGRGTPNYDRLAAKITEARFGDDSYLKIVNTRRDAPIRMDGWRVAFSNGLRVTLPLSSAVPAGGSVFIGRPVNAGGSLGSYVRSAIGMPAGLTGARLDGSDSTPSDAVGVTTSDADYREGAGTPARTFIGQGAYIRRSSAGRPVDTDDNAADFVAVDTRADEGTGTILGAPRPDRWDGPTNRNDVLQSSLVDPSQPSSAAPNRVVRGGYLTINRTVTNCSGGLEIGVCRNADPNADAVKITKLRFRVTALSTYGTSNAALLRLVGSDDASYGPLGVRGLPLDGPSPTTGGGLNSSQIATQLLPDGGLAPGESINVAFRFKVDRGGAYTFGYDTEDDVVPLPKPAAPPAAEELVPEAPPVPDTTKGTVPQSAVTAPITASTPAAATPTPTPTTAPTPGKAAPKKVCVTKRQFKKLRGKARKRAKICKPAKKTPAARTTPAR